MAVFFYYLGTFVIVSTIFVLLHKNPIYALLCLIISFLFMSCIFFSLQAFLAGAIEIIVYAGAIMVLFVFVVMMLNVQNVFEVDQKSSNDHFVSSTYCFFALILAGIMLAILLYIILNSDEKVINISSQSLTKIKDVGIRLFNEYLLIVEIASMLLLSSLITVFHLAYEKSDKNLINNDKK